MSFKNPNICETKFKWTIWTLDESIIWISTLIGIYTCAEDTALHAILRGYDEILAEKLTFYKQLLCTHKSAQKTLAQL